MSTLDHKEEMLLNLLAESGGKSVPGAVVCGKLGMDPSDVFYRIDELRSMGYRIDTKSGGYRLISIPDRVSPLEIGIFLDTADFGRSIHYRESVLSTNDIAYRLARDGAFHGELVIAEKQTRGRGRMGREWLSPEKKNLYFSVILRPDLPAERAPGMTFTAAVGLAESMRNFHNLEVKIKWPNDLMIKGKKVGGILPELHAENGNISFIILGAGLNVNMSADDLPPEIADGATSVSMEIKERVCRASFLASCLEWLEKWYCIWVEDGFAPVRERWIELNQSLGNNIEVRGPGNKNLKGRAVDMADDGALVIELPDGKTENIYAGEING